MDHVRTLAVLISTIATIAGWWCCETDRNRAGSAVALLIGTIGIVLTSDLHIRF